jgi:hypothetical protein
VTIEQKIGQLHAALAEMRIKEELVSIEPETHEVENGCVISASLNSVVDQGTAANRVTVLLNNIACLKDYLKAWCRKNGKTSTAENLIDTNKDVAIIHDLWNADKHAELRKSRSGLYPRLREPAAPSLVLRGGAGLPDPMATFQMTPRPFQIGGAGPAVIYFGVRVKRDASEPPRLLLPMHSGRQMRTQGDASLRIIAQVEDKDGNTLGWLEEISLRAVAAWEAEFAKAGLNLSR